VMSGPHRPASLWRRRGGPPWPLRRAGGHVQGYRLPARSTSEEPSHARAGADGERDVTSAPDEAYKLFDDCTGNFTY
jgi:hypothetical protein